MHYSFGHELSSPADLALAVVQTLMMIWEGDGPTRSDVRRMKAALDALGVLDTSEPSLEERRSLAVRAIVRMAEQYKRAPSRDVLGKLWVLLQVQDDAFGELATWEADSQEEWYAELGARLERYDPNPRGKKGAIGAETILAKIIVEHCDASGALGLRCKPDEDTEDAVERIRKVLASEAGDYLDALETSEKQP